MINNATLPVIDLLRENLERTAEWRHGKAEEFPDDDRNLEAAVLLKELAKQLGCLSGGYLDQRLTSIWDASLVSGYMTNLIDAESQLLREVGFHWRGDATDLVKELISRFGREREVWEGLRTLPGTVVPFSRDGHRQ